MGRGQRSELSQLSRLPEWARALLNNLRIVEARHRRSVVSILRFLADKLEREWFTEVEPLASSSATKRDEDDDDNNDDVERQQAAKRPRWAGQPWLL